MDGGKKEKPCKLNLSGKDLPFTFPQGNAFPRVIAEPRFLALLVVRGGARRLGVLPAVPALALRPGGLCGAGPYTQ